MSWSTDSNPIDYDILAYGFFCTSCLFGENAFSIKKHPSCISYTLSYNIIILSAQMLGALLGFLIMPHNIYVSTILGTLLSSAFIGYYAGNIRTQIRNKYGINGHVNEDFYIHICCSSCAVCQEAYEIRCQNNTNILDNTDDHKYDYHSSAPAALVMTK